MACILGKIKIKVGDRNSRLVVIQRLPLEKLLVRCDCEVVKEIRVSNWSRTFSCGCFQKQRAGEWNRRNLVIHGGRNTTEYETWTSMKARCLNPNAANYHRYGGQGVKICRRWVWSFKNFLEDMGLKPSPIYSIDRINPHGDYEPGNCRWATPLEQAQNKRNKRIP